MVTQDLEAWGPESGRYREDRRQRKPRPHLTHMSHVLGSQKTLTRADVLRNRNLSILWKPRMGKDRKSKHF